MEKYLYKDLNDQEDTHWWHLAKRAAYVACLKKYLKGKKNVLLDLGCGTGRNVEELSKFGKAWGVDIAPEAVKFCHQKGIKNVQVGSAYKTNFSAKNFDVVTLLDVLEHTDDTRALKEISRILKDKGLLVITVPAFSWLWSKWDEVLHHKRRYTKQTLTTILEKNGYTIKKISYLYSFLVLPVLIFRMIKSVFSKDSYSSDFNANSKLTNVVFSQVAGFERSIMMAATIPVGTSLICVAQKREN